jgi:hypothetical protein
MTANAVQDRKARPPNILSYCDPWQARWKRAMQAIAHNALPDLEESVASQQIMSARLLVLADEISPSLKSNPAVSPAGADADMMQQVLVAGDTLQKLNRRYAALLQHSSRSVALMASLFSSYKGQFKEASGPRLKHQTWSCQM